MFIYITDNLHEAKKAIDSGATMIMVDLEQQGKEERQASRNTRISKHNLKNVPSILKAVGSDSAMVRIDGPKVLDFQILDELLRYGVTRFMVPMWESIEQLQTIQEYCEKSSLIDRGNLLNIVPLIETWASLKLVSKLEKFEYPWAHFGLNDLSLEINCENMFDIMDYTAFRSACKNLARLRVPFGIGGIGLPMKKYKFPIERMISSHNDFGAAGFIFTRDFNRLMDADPVKFSREVSNLVELYKG